MAITHKCYIVELSTELEGLFDELHDAGIPYNATPFGISYLEVLCVVEEREIPMLQSIFAPYV